MLQDGVLVWVFNDYEGACSWPVVVDTSNEPWEVVEFGSQAEGRSSAEIDVLPDGIFVEQEYIELDGDDKTYDAIKWDEYNDWDYQGGVASCIDDLYGGDAHAFIVFDNDELLKAMY
jgi:hypothetical protein